MTLKRANRCEFHRYRKYQTEKGASFWKCMDCPHYMYVMELLIGRIVRCYLCSSPFKVDATSLERAKIRCADCTGKTREDILDEGSEELLSAKNALGQPAFDLKSLLKQVAEKNREKDEDPPSLEDQQNKVIRDLIRSGSEQEG